MDPNVDYAIMLVVVCIVIYYRKELLAYIRPAPKPKPQLPTTQQLSTGLLNVPPPSIEDAEKALVPVTQAAIAQSKYVTTQAQGDTSNAYDPIDQYLLNNMQKNVSNIYDPDYSPVDMPFRYLDTSVNKQDLKYETAAYYQMKDMVAM